MHGAMLLFTNELPTDDDITKIMEPYAEWACDTSVFCWDSWKIGGRYSGEIQSKVSTIRKDGDNLYLSIKRCNCKEIRSLLFDTLEKLTSLAKALPFPEHYVYGYLLEPDGSIRCDGAYIRNITNRDKIRCYICMDKDAAYCRDTTENFDAVVSRFFDQYLENDGFVTKLDIHW